MNTDIIWKRIDTKTNKILLKSKLEEEDIRKEIWENNENDMRQDGFSKKYNDFNESYEFQYWIDKDTYNDENVEIDNFNEKCRKWEIGHYIEKDIYLSVDENVDFNKFNFIKDDRYNEEWNNPLFAYEEKNTYIKLNYIDIEVLVDNFDNKYIEINEDNKKIDDFMKKLESRIIECIKKNNFNIEENYEYKYYKNDNCNYKFKIKKEDIEPKEYKNAIVYIKCNRLWKLNYQKQGNDIYNWGVSFIVDKIIEDN